MFIDAVQTIHLIWSLLSLIQTEDEKKQFMGLVRPTSASRIKIETLEDWKTQIQGPLFADESHERNLTGLLHFDPFFSLNFNIIPLKL